MTFVAPRLVNASTDAALSEKCGCAAETSESSAPTWVSHASCHRAGRVANAGDSEPSPAAWTNAVIEWESLAKRCTTSAHSSALARFAQYVVQRRPFARISSATDSAAASLRR